MFLRPHVTWQIVMSFMYTKYNVANYAMAISGNAQT